MAINLSGRQLLARDFAPALRRAVERARIAPTDIELELTEGTLLRDTAAVRDVLEELHGDGFRIALDDFGTGYCSVAYFEKFPISTLKVDGSFVRGITLDQHRRNLVGGIIQLARRLELDVVAEGVETAEQRDVLAEERCRIMQGHLFATALAPEQFPSVCARA
jgi:EAL domain-containing protein (putative c-di-GMP-specific phosphodiesterase class I)